MVESLPKPFVVYELRREEFEKKHPGEVALAHESGKIDCFPTYDDALNAAIAKYDGADCHIREIGVEYPKVVFSGYEA